MTQARVYSVRVELEQPLFGAQAEEEQATEKQELNSAEVDEPQKARIASDFVPLLNDTDQQSR